MGELTRHQAAIVERAVAVPLPLEKVISLLGVPTVFASKQGKLSFHSLSFGKDDVLWLIPEAAYDDRYTYSESIIIKKDDKPMAALCRGVDIGEAHNHQPIAALFNLTEPGSLQVMIVGGNKPGELENDYGSKGGLNLSKMLRNNPKKQVVKITADTQGLAIAIVDGIIKF